MFGLVSFEYAVFFCLPKSLSIKCFKQFFESSSDRGWVDKVIRSKFKVCCYDEFVNDLRYVHNDVAGDAQKWKK